MIMKKKMKMKEVLGIELGEFGESSWGEKLLVICESGELWAQRGESGECEYGESSPVA